MKLWAVITDYSYEGQRFLGVFDDKLKAYEEREGHYSKDSIRLVEIEVNKFYPETPLAKGERDGKA